MWLITGNRGYIGTNLTAKLTSLGELWEGFDIKDGLDILDKESLREYMKGCDVVVHLAAISGIQACEEDKQKTWSVNMDGTFYVESTAMEMGIKPILFSSQAAINPTSIYGRTKQAIERFKDEAVILRPSNIYGGLGFEKKKNAFNEFLSADPIMVKSPEAHRDFVHISKVVKEVLESISRNPGVYDVVSGDEISILTLARIIGTVRGVKVKRK